MRGSPSNHSNCGAVDALVDQSFFQLPDSKEPEMSIFLAKTDPETYSSMTSSVEAPLWDGVTLRMR